MRLIDADTLRAEFTGNFHELWHYTGIWAMIDCAPTVDAVPVVRCKNCKFSRERKGTERVVYVEGVWICEHPEVSEDAFCPVVENHYCSYGERKEE